jgi:hypothetical protein
MIKSGFGNLTDLLESTVVLGDLVDSNRNAVIQLSGKQEKRITDIVAGYSTGDPANLVSDISGGRLLVVGAKFDSLAEFIDPVRKDLPASLSSSVIYLDVFFGQAYTLNADIPRFQYHTDKGIHVPKGTDASVILTFALTNTAPYPASLPVVAFLNVDGLSGGSDAPFKNIR